MLWLSRPFALATTAYSVLSFLAMDRKRSKTERRNGERTTPSPESIQANIHGMAESVRNLQTQVEALIKRPNVLPWRRKCANADTDAS